MQEDEHPIVHSDRGAYYGLAKWSTVNLYARCSKKGCSPNNAACEVFLDGLRMSSFMVVLDGLIYIEDFIELLDEYLQWYNNQRIKLSLGGVSIVKYRASMSFL